MDSTRSSSSFPDIHLTLPTVPDSNSEHVQHVEPCRPYKKLPDNKPDLFTGRTDVLEEMEKGLKDGKGIILLHGRTALGKKATAVQFVVSKCVETPCVIYVSCAQKSVMESEIITICHELNLSQTEDHLCINTLHHYLKQHSGWALILGGCGEEVKSMLTESKPRLLPAQEHLHGMVIITSSINENLWRDNRCIQYRSLEVQPFTLEESKTFICRYTKRKTDSSSEKSACQKIHDITDGSPSLLRKIIGDISAKRKTLAEYVATLGNEEIQGLFKGISKPEFKEVEQFPRAAMLLHILCFLFPHAGVPLDMFIFGLPKALNYDLGAEDACHHVKSLRELGMKISQSQNKHKARSILKDDLEIPLKHSFISVFGHELEILEVSEFTQQSYLQFIKNSESSRCCRKSRVALKLACLCSIEAMQAEKTLRQPLRRHLKQALAESLDCEQTIFTARIPARVKATVARHYVDGGSFNSVIRLLANLDPSTPELQDRNTMTCSIWLARSHVWLGNLSQAIEILEKAATACQAPEKGVILTHLVCKGVILTHLACAKTEAGAFQSAKKDLDQAQSLLDEAGFPAAVDDSDYFHMGLHEGEIPRAFLASRFGKWNRWKMNEALASDRTEKQDLESVIRDSIKHFTDAFGLYRDHGNTCQMLIMDMYSALQVQSLQQLLGDEQPSNPNSVAHCEGLVTRLEEVLLPDHPHLGWMKERMAFFRSQALGAREQQEKALKELDEGTRVTQGKYGSTHRKVATGLWIKAGILDKLGEVNRAVACLEKAKKILNETRKAGFMDSKPPKLRLVENMLRDLEIKKDGKRQ